MPTGVALHDVRRQLFDAAERVLLRDGPNALTSRAVTTEAGCAKGVLHKHFDDFDDFLAALVRRRVDGIEGWGAAMRSAAGSGVVAENIADALHFVFDPVGLGLIALIIARDGLRTRLRDEQQSQLRDEQHDRLRDKQHDRLRDEQHDRLRDGQQDQLHDGLRGGRGSGLPMLAETTAVLVAYLAAERDTGRVPKDAEVTTLALTLVGTAHLVFAGGENRPAEIHRLVAAILR